MRMTKFENYTTFEFDRPNAPWTLCVIDDWWDEARGMFEEVGYPFEPAKLKDWEDKYAYHSDTYALMAIGYLLVEAEKLSEVNRVIFTDFPRTADGTDFLPFLRDRPEGMANLAMLIDLTDDNRKRERVEVKYVFPALSRLGMPITRCAYFTQGSRAAVELDRILKADFVAKRELVLGNWWSRFLGGIDEEYFENETSRHGRQNWHNPSTLAAARHETGFMDFLGWQADRDYYGVWRWVYYLVKNAPAIEPEQMYAFLCGKAFLRCGGKDRKRPFYYTALRGLVYGLGRGVMTHDPVGGLPCCRNVAVVDEINRPAPPLVRDLSKPGLPINSPKYYGSYTTGQANFATFAESIWNWLDKLESDINGTARLARLNLTANADLATLTLTFTEPLPHAIFSGGEKGGLVTRGYSKLQRCFSDDCLPRITSDFRQITLTFLLVIEPASGESRGEHDELR